MNAIVGAALMIAAVLLFRFLKANEDLAERLRQSVPGIWIAVPLLIMFGFIGGAAIVVIDLLVK
jgi:hypothetical protein